MNGYRRLVLLVEGNDDRRFAESVLCPLAESSFDFVEIYEYAQKKPAKVNEYVSTISFVPDWSYIFIADFDEGPCMTLKMDQLILKYGGLDVGRILVVKREIESWYLAGLDADSCDSLEVPLQVDTNNLRKERFDSLKPSHFDNRTDFMVEVLRRFDISTARSKNQSFDYAMGKYFIPTA